MSKVIKSKKNQKFTTVFNSVLQKKELSWAAKGLYCYITSLPDDWVMYKTEIKKHASNGRTSFETAWTELEDLGYIVGADMVRTDGQFGGRDYIFYDLSEDDRKAFTDAQNQQRPMHEINNGEISSETQKIDQKPSNQSDLPMHETNIGTDARNQHLLNTNNTTKDLLQICADAPTESKTKVSLKIRKEQFRKHVYDVGGLIYTKRMLEEFIRSWSEANRAKTPKMKFEKEATWETDLRLANWARRNYSKIPCYLTESQKTIKHKKHELSLQLEKFVDKYHPDTLNKFWLYWGEPENRPEPTRLRWESEEFWDLAKRLSQWAARNPQVQSGNPPAQRHSQANDR